MTGAQDLKPFCVVYGQNTFLRRRALDRIMARELGGGDPSLNLQRVDGRQAEVSDVLDDVRTFSLMGGRRVVVVDEADALVTRSRATLERYAASPSDTGCLILVCNNFDGRTRLHKAVASVGEIVQCKPAKGQALRSWLVAHARDEYGKRMSPQAAYRLHDQVGDSHERLDGELAKLSLYVGDREEIMPQDVEAVVGCYREQTVFAVMDAISEGDAGKALNEWHRVLATDPAASGRAIGGLAWGARRLLDARRRLDAGESPHSLARAFWTDPDVFLRRMQGSTAGQRQDQLLELLAADLGSKTGATTFNVAVEKFIVKHSLRATGS
ncbi:MAG: DNA polymerase III subunit delta [Phycisphaerae bacterium]